jgi:hypothetical protein
MPTWIVTHSEFVCNFLTPLLVVFSPAQLRHALNFVEAVLVCTARHKTLAALTRWLRLDDADEYAWADFFRVSRWSGEAVRTVALGFLLKTVAAIQVKTGWRLLFLSVGDSLCRKDIATHKLQAVSLRFDHVRQRRQQGQFTNASRYVATHLQLGPVQFLLTSRLYAKRQQVKALNQHRRAQGLPPLKYQSLPSLVQQMLAEIAPPSGEGEPLRGSPAQAVLAPAPQLPPQCKVYVLFDAWYAGHRLFKSIRAHGWHWLCAAKANHRLDAFQLPQWWQHLGHQPIERVTLRSTKGSRTYSTRYRVKGGMKALSEF